jgi:predicted MPP superfamily phosphohydrolase
MQSRVREIANEFDPDLVVFTGDMINHPRLASEAGEYLAGFKHRNGKYFVTGDVDGAYDLPEVLARGGFELLDGKSKVVSVGPSRFSLIGVSIAGAWDHDLVKRLSAQAAATPRILLSHRPDAVTTADGLVDLVVSGHTHGGQVCLPFIGPVMTLTRVARSIAAGGLHRSGKQQILLSRGLGWEGHFAPRVRMFCRPHLLLVVLKPA